MADMPHAAPDWRLGFDIGGTFTDIVLVESGTGETHLGKSLTTPQDPSVGVANGVAPLFQRLGMGGSEVSVAIHATTLITNALIERKGARTALLATQGFRDTIEMATELRYDNYAISLAMPEPLVSRRLRFDVPERLDRDGNVLVPLDEAKVREIAGTLKAEGVETVAIVFLHSFRNAAHEERAAEIVREVCPDILVSLSSHVSPEIREYERSVTTCANAFVQPLTPRYIDKALQGLASSGYANPLYVMVSSGGIASAEVAKDLPIRLLESGPTAGVMAAIYYGKALGIGDLVTFDMGGTTAKIGLVSDYRAQKSNVFEVGRVSRFQKGSGLPVRIPMVELIEIGAGGGSIAKVNTVGLLDVGPDSAGAVPGPACYDRGGTRPTVTDANVVLGYLNPDYFLGGEMQLDAAAARDAIATLSAPLGESVEACARGIASIVNQNMLAASKIHIAERGADPRKLYLFAFGGAGPAHAYELARSLHMKGVIVPPGAGATSAMGLVTAPVSFDFARSFMVRLDRAAPDELTAVFAQMEAEGAETMAQAGVPAGDIVVERTMDLRHAGQGYQVNVAMPDGPIDRAMLDTMGPRFYAAHEERFGHAHTMIPAELVTCRVTVSGRVASIPVPDIAAATDEAAPVKAWRMVYFPELGTEVETPVYERSQLRHGHRIPGAAVFEERECTIVAGPSATTTIDRYGSVRMDLTADGSA
ncbi:hydantoinase/oxoprolinase family protein [Acuticoccus sediminis]|uniref:hydantoinase/oxoprolinase family protein n=1 Tax=Acuticoccus sediminis TaxID=2184697 RepID=UPI001CFF3FEB|nr:hydantoinase/oxoprolinase family protein [Acuticoccus sediminis]